jgi:hypothetical protein
MSKTKHILKSWPRFFDAIRLGTRTHELRRNDRDFQVGDLLELHEFEYSTMKYTGRTCIAEITSITSAREPCAVSDEALHRDFCILSVRLVPPVQ